MVPTCINSQAATEQFCIRDMFYHKRYWLGCSCSTETTVVSAKCNVWVKLRKEGTFSPVFVIYAHYAWGTGLICFSGSFFKSLYCHFLTPYNELKHSFN